MKKEHQSPEFVVIKQDQANAKFFVASDQGPFQTTNTVGASYETDDDNSTTNDDGGFDF